MAKINVEPFDSLTALLCQALQSAISYDQDLINCGGYMVASEERVAIRKVKTLRKLLEIVAPGRKTMNEELNDFLGDLIDIGAGRMMTLQELKMASKKETK